MSNQNSASSTILTSYQSNNDLLVAQISKLYLPIGCKVADVTYGKGVFWRNMDMTKYGFFPSDLMSQPKNPPPNLQRYDFTALPYKDGEFDVVVFDPPYVHNPGDLIVDKNYQNASTTKGFYHKDIIELYRKGMVEGVRILKEGGTLWVKCKDEIESSLQRWSHCEIYELALAMGLYGKDLFVMTQKQDPILQHKEQQHARKNHSYMWILRKPFTNEYKRLQKVYPQLKGIEK